MALNNHNIETLLEKFWQGETSLAEEKELRIFFKENPVNNYPAESAYFSVLNKNEGGLSEEFDNELLAKIQAKKTLPRIRVWMRRAAIFITLIGSGTLVWHLSGDKTVTDNVNTAIVTEPIPDAEVAMAYQQTKEALMLVSSKLNKGKEQTLLLGKFGEAQQQVKNGIEQ